MFAWFGFPTFASRKWSIQGYDGFAGVTYSLPGRYRSEAKARRAAEKFIRTLQLLQPANTSGSEEPVGIRDRVYIVRPNGAMSYVPAQP